jgi:hypothetical protein
LFYKFSPTFNSHLNDDFDKISTPFKTIWIISHENYLMNLIIKLKLIWTNMMGQKK